MTDAEFELIDSLYFTLSFDQLQKELNWEREKLRNELMEIIRKGWAKALVPETEEEVEDPEELEKQYLKYLYLASKKGLMAHNSR